MHVRVPALVALGIFGCVEPPSGETDRPRSSSLKLVHHADAIADHYIVVLDDATPLAPAASRSTLDGPIDRMAGRYAARVDHRYSGVLYGFSALMSATDAAALAGDPEVLYVEQDTLNEASVVQSNPTWGIDRIDQPSLPLDAMYSYTADGTGTTVFVIDSGINTTHLEFTGRVRTDLGATAINDGGGVEDCNGHGSHVAGTIGGTVFGVAKKTTLVPVRVGGCGPSVVTSDLIAGMDFVAMNHPARSVANISIGGAASDAKDAAVRNMVAMGVTVVVAAGNEAVDACTKSPAREPMAITVASSTNADARSNFSNFGTCVDLFAPGSGITSAWIGGNNIIETISGTSMASPHVAGAAALYLSANPNATPAQVAAGLLAATAPNKISDVQGSPNKLLQSSVGAAPPPPPPPGSCQITMPVNNAEVASTFDVTVAAMGAVKVDLGIDGKLAGSDPTPPFAFTITNLAAGKHQIGVTATDAAGKTASHAIDVMVKAGGGGGFGGGNPVPPPSRIHDPAGCSTGRSPSGLGLTAILLLGLLLRRRKR